MRGPTAGKCDLCWFTPSSLSFLAGALSELQIVFFYLETATTTTDQVRHTSPISDLVIDALLEDTGGDLASSDIVSFSAQRLPGACLNLDSGTG
jgi:hypothetical protein